MTLEAVNGDANIGVATTTKVFLGFPDLNRRIHMASQALPQTVFCRADTTMNCVIALVHEVVHMVAPHDTGLLNALFSLYCFGDLRSDAVFANRSRCG